MTGYPVVLTIVLSVIYVILGVGVNNAVLFWPTPKKAPDAFVIFFWPLVLAVMAFQ